MKVDTKKMTPMSKVASPKDSFDSWYLNPNKYISDGASTLRNESKEDENDSDTKLGSLIRYVPVLFFTPVKSTSRLPDRQGTVDAKGVEELTKAFGKQLFLGDEKEAEEEKDEATSAKDDANEDGKRETVSDTEGKEGDTEVDEPKLGLYKTQATTHKSNGPVTVTRSHRLEEDNE